MFKRIAKTLTTNLVTGGTLKIGFVDRMTLADDGHRVFVDGTRYDSPTDFTIAVVNDKGDGVLTWLNATTINSGKTFLLGLATIDSITSGDVTGSGGGGGGAITSVDLGTKAEAAATTDTGTFSLIALFKRAMGKWTSMLATLGAPADGAWTTGDMTLTAGIKALATKANSAAPTLVSRAPYTVRRVITPNTNVAAGQGVMIACTVAGIQQLELSSGDILAVPVVIGTSWIDNIAVIDAPSASTTATATVTVLAVS